MPCDLYRDAPCIKNEMDLWRRIPRWHLVYDENQGGVRISSAAFEDDPDGNPMSVFVADFVRDAGKNENDVLAGHKNFALASMTAGLAREQNQGVALEPANFPGHAVIFGKKTKSISRAFAKAAKWVIAPAQ